MNGPRLLLLATSLMLVLAVDARPAAAQISFPACGTINNSGSYALTGNLSATGTCITVDADDVTIDLKGFTISGNGTGTGIFSPVGFPSHTNLSILNGTIKGFGTGIFVDGTGLSVENVRVLSNQSTGIAGPACTIRNNTVRFNQGTGISCGGVITGNIVDHNTGDGINASGVITGNSVDSNGADGIFAGEDSVVIGNTASFNGNIGIEVGCRAVIQSNVATKNTVKNIVTTGADCTKVQNSF
jgi:hypothetical protein